MLALLPLHIVRSFSRGLGAAPRSGGVTCRSVGVACGAVWDACWDVAIAWRSEGEACTVVGIASKDVRVAWRRAWLAYSHRCMAYRPYWTERVVLGMVGAWCRVEGIASRVVGAGVEPWWWGLLV